MRVAVQNPSFLLENQERNFNGYNYIFTKKYVDIIYLTNPVFALRVAQKLKELNWKKKIIFSVSRLNRCADVLICFNGKPYIEINKPEVKFKGIKIYHSMDYSDNASVASACYSHAGVDYLLAYSQADKYSGFFKKYFKSYINKVIPVEFGFGDRFQCKKSFEKRINKCIAMGAVNPIKDPEMDNILLNDYISYYADYEYSHPIRRKIVENMDKWSVYIESKLPVYPETKNNNYDAVEELNNYTMFINDSSIDYFPPARTFEGIACGTVMVAEDLEIYKRLGFVDGKNCILFRAGDYDDMIKKITYYQDNYEELYILHKGALKLAEEYSHSAVAKKLYDNIYRIVKS